LQLKKGNIHRDKTLLRRRMIIVVPLMSRGITHKDTFESTRI
jgi:hypothetical protein